MKKFLTPNVEVVKFEVEDVITTSTIIDEGGVGTSDCLPDL